MRLKFLFFPIILVISLSIFIGYIWPEIKNLQGANEEKMNNEALLGDISAKKAAIQNVGTQISNDGDGEAVIKNYLSDKRMEEKILTNVNFLATDSGISLVDISIENGEEPLQETDELDQDLVNSISPIAAIANNINSQNNAESNASLKKNSKLQYVSAQISANGEYEKIRLFLNQLQRISILNSVESVTISSLNVEKKNDSVEDSVEVVSAEVASQVATTLNVKAVVNFGWMSLISVDQQKAAVFKPGFDKETISIVKNYISQKTPAVDTFGDVNGKKNPFLSL